jgi:hypothetical protein
MTNANDQSPASETDMRPKMLAKEFGTQGQIDALSLASNTDIEAQKRAASLGAMPALVDPEKGIYRFSSGVCRDITQITAPWKLKKFDGGIDLLGMEFEANHADFGIPVIAEPLKPYEDQRKHIVDMFITNPAAEHSRAGLKYYQDLVTHPEQWGKPGNIVIAVSPGSQAYISPHNRVILVNQELRTAVDFVEEVSMFNGKLNDSVAYRAHVLLSEDEIAIFFVNYAAISKLDDISRSIHMLANAMRRPCPAVK